MVLKVNLVSRNRSSDSSRFSEGGGLRNKKRSIKRKIYPNLNSYIKSQTTRKFPLFRLHSKMRFWLRKMQIENPFLYRVSQIIFLFLLEQLCPGFGLFRMGLGSLLSCLCGVVAASRSKWGSKNMPGLIKAVAPSSTGIGDMPIFRAPSSIGSVAGESSSVPHIEVDEVPLEEIWAALAPVRNLSQETSLRQRLNAFGNEESPLLLGMNKRDYWEEVKSKLGSASTQSEYNNLLEFESRDLQIRELKHECYALFRETLEAQVVGKFSSTPKSRGCPLFFLF